jgi:hypothetical protein
MPAVDVNMGAVHAACAGVCLEHHGHTDGVTLPIKGSVDASAMMCWPEVTDQHLRTHNDMQDATECGACGVAFMIALSISGYEVLLRSKKGDGFDYYLGKDDPDRMYQNAARLEVSGILEGTDVEIQKRVRQKLKQTDPSDTMGLPAFVCVVEFSQPLAVYQVK